MASVREKNINSNGLTGQTSGELRKHVEKLLIKGDTEPPVTTAHDSRRLLHELQVHQIELAQQNENLRSIQLKLEDSHARFEDLYDNAPVGYFSFDENGRILAVNLTGSRQLGLRKDILLKKNFSSFMCQDDSDLFYLHLKKVFATGSKQTCSLTLIQKNGQAFFVQIDSLPPCAPDQNQFCKTTITDISARKELEEALLSSGIRYRRLFESAMEGILILDAETGLIADINPFLLEMLGYSREDLSGKKLWEIGCFKDVGASIEIFNKLRDKGYVRYDHLPLETRDGRLIAVEFISNAYSVKGHKVIQCSIRDITCRELTTPTPPQEARNGSERRVIERRVEPRLAGRHSEQKEQEQQQTEKSLLKALAEIKMLKDRLVTENVYFRQEVRNKQQFDHIIGQSDGIKYVLYRVEQVAPTNTTVLILGETGTGKELIAGAIHHLSSRRDQPLITVNCAALPANLLESELFGREKGAFTGADTKQIGRFEIANGSTLCLDEIGELPLEMQAKLLRVIQHGEFERLGSSKTIKVDVRIVATTNRNLEEEILTGTFRKDLYYRLNVFPITVPPLRQRKEDIPLMVQAFVERYARKLGKKITSISKETLQALQDYPWPGNVRELESIIERAVILCQGPGFKLAENLNISAPSPVLTGGTVKEMEVNLIMQVLSEKRWRIEGKDGAAETLGLHPSTLRARMHKLGIVRPEINEAK